VRMF